MTDVLKELVERASALQKQIDDGDGAYPSEFSELANDLMDALPALKSLLSQEDVGDSDIAPMFRSKLFQKFLSQGFWHAHHVDLVWRMDGKEVREEADWLKDLWYFVRGKHAQSQPSPVPSQEPETQAVDVPRGLIEALRDHQKQCDEDGVECQVSRRAVDEAVAILSKPLYRSPVESVPKSVLKELVEELREEAKAYWKDGYLVGGDIVHQCADRLSAIVKERGK